MFKREGPALAFACQRQKQPKHDFKTTTPKKNLRFFQRRLRYRPFLTNSGPVEPADILHPRTPTTDSGQTEPGAVAGGGDEEEEWC